MHTYMLIAASCVSCYAIGTDCEFSATTGLSNFWLFDVEYDILYSSVIIIPTPYNTSYVVQ
jgi:hypothetical protein